MKLHRILFMRTNCVLHVQTNKIKNIGKFCGYPPLKWIINVNKCHNRAAIKYYCISKLNIQNHTKFPQQQWLTIKYEIFKWYF